MTEVTSLRTPTFMKKNLLISYQALIIIAMLALAVMFTIKGSFAAAVYVAMALFGAFAIKNEVSGKSV
ncbi:hypothetical protein T472_0213005 [Youngiibacter fragilis 232.1]|uniref:Uncharacterized protein n=2 Tax=Youngiibacter TaxID=1408818 RepID=V7I206_9CLOT|nr:hypothetical protein T472_0213005 [Youngiibacter fragilis 232.1]